MSFLLFLYFVNLLIFCLKGCSAQVLQFGSCGNVETMKYFELEKFLGKWYEIERFPTWYEDYGKCASKTVQYCGRTIEILHAFVRDGMEIVLHVNSTYAPGDEAIFYIDRNNIDPMGIPFSIISTDYDNYAIIYGCADNIEYGIKYISAWILSRRRTIEPETLAKAHLELNAIPYASTAYLQTVEQDEDKCRYFWTAHVQAENMYENNTENNVLHAFK